MAHKRSFHDQWYRIKDLRVGLRSGTQVQEQTYRKEVWLVLHEPAHNGFFRARPDTYARIKALRPDHSLGHIWEEQTRLDPATAPGQEAFFDLISALYRANLLYVEGGVSETQLLERAIRKKQKPLPAKISETLFFRIPLLDPDPFLSRHRRLIASLFSTPAVALVMGIMILALVTFAFNSSRAMEQSSTILQTGNLISLYLCIFATHMLHEMSHAALTKHYGGQVRTMGVMLLLFTPLPYADLTSAWGFRDKYKRCAVGAAGMYADLLTGSLACLLWANSPPGFINEVALNIMFVTAVYTFLFNINPLMRFDGYYVLSDLVEIPNLHSAAKAQFGAVFKHLALQEPYPPDQQVSRRRRLFLLVFFMVSNIYRIAVMLGIVVFIADQYFGLGLIVGMALFYNAILSPVVKVMKPLANPHFTRKNRKPLSLMGLFAAIVLAVLCFVPLPDARRLSGVIDTAQITLINAPVSGVLLPGTARPGQPLAQGDLIAQLATPELDLQERALAARLRGAEIRAARARARQVERLAAITEEITALRRNIEEIRVQKARAEIRAPQGGIWVDQGLGGHHGMWLRKGTPLGRIAPQDGHVFQAVLRQEAAESLAGARAGAARLRLEGARGRDIVLRDLRLVPYSRRDLPSQALTPLGGGSVAISAKEENQGQAIERFFLLIARFDAGQAGGALLGRSGWLRLSVESRPLAQQGLRAARQFFQQRYKL